MGTRTEIVWDDIYRYVDEAIADLPEALRVPVVAHFLDDQTHEAIAQTLGLTRQGVTYRIGQGIERVRKGLKRRGVPLTAMALAALLKANLTEAAPASLVGLLGRLALMGPVAASSSAFSGLARLLTFVPSAKSVAIGCAVVIVAACGYFGYRSTSSETQIQDPALSDSSSTPVSGATQPLAATKEPRKALSPAAKPAGPVPGNGTEILTGTVTDMGGTPIAGATVSMGSGWAGSEDRTTTDSSGRFSVTYNVQTRVYTLSLGALNYLGLTYRFRPVVHGARLELRMKMIAGREYRGTLADREGKPICGAIVVGADQRYGPNTITDADGSFAVLADPVHPSLKFVHPDFLEFKTDMEAQAIEAGSLKVQAPRAGALRVRVLRGSTPVPGVHVEVSPSHSPTSGVSDENGIAVIQVPAPASYAPTARDNEGNIAVLRSGATTVQEGGLAECTVTFPADYPASVRGRVLDAKGAPLPNVSIRITHERHPEVTREITVAQDGTYTAGLEMGKSAVVAYVPGKGYSFEGGNSHELIVTGPKQFEEDFRAEELKEPTMYSVTMADSAGERVTDAVLRPATEPQYVMSGTVDLIVHAEEGEFLLDGNAPLTIFDQEKEATVSLGRPIDVNTNPELSCMYEVGTGRSGRLVRRTSESEEIFVRFDQQSGSIAGTVVDDFGTPLPMVYASLDTTGSRMNIRQTTAEGSFRFDLLPINASYTIRLLCGLPRHEAGATFEGIIPTNPPVPIRFVIRSTEAEVSGIAVTEENVSAPEAFIHCYDVDGKERSIRADKEGKFALVLPKGTYNFWTSNEHWESSDPVQIVAPAKGVVLVVPSSPGHEQAASVPDDALHAQRKNTMLQIGLIFKMFANESKGGIYPALANIYGAFYPDPKPLYPEYITDAATLAALTGMQDVKLCYFGYAMETDEAASAFLDAYEAYGPEGLQGQDLPLDEGDAEEVGMQKIFRLREGIERFYITDINDPAGSPKAQSTLPIAWELPAGKEMGAWVLYLDGHTEWKSYPGEFPMTETLVTRVKAIMASGR